MMAVHVPLSKNSVKECLSLMMSEKNIISPAHGRPLAVPSQEMVLGLYFLTKKKKSVLGEGTFFPSVEYAMAAYQNAKIHMQAGVKLRLESGQLVDTTMGRVIFYSVLPREVDFSLLNMAMKKKDITKMISKMYSVCGMQKTVIALDKIKKLGFGMATKSGISIGMQDLIIPSEKKELVAKAFKEVVIAEDLYRKGAITNGERRNKVIQVWAKATEDVANAMMKNMERLDGIAASNEDPAVTDFNPVFMMLDSGSKGSKQQIRQLNGMRGLMSNPSGDVMEIPVLANFKEGLSSFEYFISTHGARKGLADTALKTADAGYLTRRLVDVSQDVVVTTQDCKTAGFIEVESLEEGGNVIEPLADRVYSRICAKDVKDPITGELIVSQGQLIDEKIVVRLKDSAVSKVQARSVLTCAAKRGVCALCYGLDLSTGQIVYTGVAVGIIAAQSIGEPGTQLTLRTFHTGGTASGLVEEYHRNSRYAGKVTIRNCRLINNPQGLDVVVNRRARVLIISEDGRELESHRIEYGSFIFVKEGQDIEVGTRLFESTPYGVILTEQPGKIEFVDLVKNATYIEKFDEETGVSKKVVLERKDEKRQPYISVIDNNDDEVCRYHLPNGAQLSIERGQKVEIGQVIAIIPREQKKAKDITGGLPRIVELFEARVPKDAAVLSDIDGKVSFGGIHRGQRRINVTAYDGQVCEYSIPRNKRLNVEDGEEVFSGYPLTVGSQNVHDILRIMGPDEAQKYLVKEIQEVYTTQGVNIHDKHIEAVVRQMLRKVKIVDSGESNFVVGEKTDKIHLQSVNKALAAAAKKVAISKPVLMGITKASLETESFIAAASFQETTRILSEAAVTGQVDYLRCLKSNVAIGRLIPAGTGIPDFRERYLGDSVSELEREAREEEELEAGLDSISLD
jgi:DNA-directed RNA polymerase subunit beta'